MFRLLALSGFVLVYLAFTANCAVVKRSTMECTPSLADAYCRKNLPSSRNPSGKCEEDAIMCYMTSPRCRNDAGCIDACLPLGDTDVYVEPQCISKQCRCEVSDLCTESNCQERCVMESEGKSVESSECMANNTCVCSYFDPCTGTADCKVVCEKEYPGKRMLSTRCGSDKQCLCAYLDGGTGTAIRPSVLTIAIILLTTLAMIPAPAEGKLGALLIPSAIFGFSTSQLAFG